MHSEFELVKKKRTRKRKSQLKCQIGDLDFESEIFLIGKLNKSVEEFESSLFSFELLHRIDSCLSLNKQKSIKEVLCYGIGNFSDSKSALHQLAALCVLQKKYNLSVIIYDPVFSETETKVLQNLKFEVLPENEEGKREISKSHITLAFFPHCPKQLTNNFLWKNWNNNLRNCILITNSFSNIIVDNTEKVLQESAKYIQKIAPFIQEIILENNYNIENIFNNFSIHCFNYSSLTESFFQKTLEEEPVYLNETELITKAFESLELKNG